MKKINNSIVKIGFSFLVFIIILYAGILHSNIITQAKTKNDKLAEVRLIFTTDLHGQLNSKDYEKGVDYKNGGLARAFDLIQKARKEKLTGNSFTFDVGDVMYDYTTEYIFAENQKAIQPIYQAMSMVGYDAITLGNHDFDYGLDYIMNQLNETGLKDITVLSNVTDSKSGAYPFVENKIITKEVETTNGGMVEVNIGIIGETIPTLTEKEQDYTGILKTEDIVANVKTQSKKLKDDGADIVVVLAHTGMGPEEPELNYKNVAYALSKIEDVDVILCGHEHNTFPTDDKTSPYLKLSGVDPDTYLVNGKNVVMASDRGKSIGLVDLTLRSSSGKIEIINRKSQVRFVSRNVTKEDPQMILLNSVWEGKLLEYTNKVIGTVQTGEVINNFFGLLQDNNAIQLLNDAKRAYAIRYISTDGIKYKDYPVLAASTYSSFGTKSHDDFVNIKNEITESKLATMQPYNKYLVLYTINGKQLKEWLEWTASAYEVTDGETKWENVTISELMKETGLKSLIKEEWLNEWNNFYVFDGVNYTMNPKVEARYDISGDKINDTNRISNISYNGKPVTDTMEFILAADKIAKTTQANTSLDKQAIYIKFNRGQEILAEYIKSISKIESISPVPDYNWNLSLSNDYKFIMKAPEYADTFAQNSSWYSNTLKTFNNYNYYTANLPNNNLDIISPNVLLVATNTEPTGIGYNVIVNTTDLSGIKTIKYTYGDYDSNYGGWSYAYEVKDNNIQVNEDGIISVYVEDNAGNKTVKQIMIDNINRYVIGMPKVDTYTNRKTSIKGKAEPKTTVYVETSTGTYNALVPSSGKFSIKMPSQPSGSEITVYAMDENSGRVSNKYTFKVKRTGPNQPVIYQVYNNSNLVSGNMNDDDAYAIAIVDNKVYIPKKIGSDLYKNALEIYNPDFKIIQTDASFNSNGTYSLNVGPLKAGTTVTIYNVDHLYRVSRTASVKVKDNGPNLPTVNEISNIERQITGHVSLLKNKALVDVYAEVNGNTYHTQTDSKGNFIIPIVDQLQANQTFSVYATDNVNNIIRKSAIKKVKVKSIDVIVNAYKPTIKIDDITNTDKMISGSYDMEDETLYLAIGNEENGILNNNLYEIKTDHNGYFVFNMEESLPIGTKVYIMSRFIDDDIIAASAKEVVLGKPIKPYLEKDITNTTKKVYVVTSKDAKVIVQIGDKTYKTDKYEYNADLDGYVYSVDVNRTNAGTKIKVYAENSAGKSKSYTSEIVKLAPDSPKVKTVYTNTSTITGKVDIIETVIPDENEDNTEDSSAPNTNNVIQKDSTDLTIADNTSSKTETVDGTNSKTKVFAKIGTKTYEGVVDENGNFKISIKNQKEGTVIYIWGENQSGRGPITKVIVKKYNKKN